MYIQITTQQQYFARSNTSFSVKSATEATFVANGPLF